jgi:hypothetical protein
MQTAATVEFDPRAEEIEDASRDKQQTERAASPT